MKNSLKQLLLILAICFSHWSYAAANLEINTPAINALKNSMQSRHAKLAAHYNSGAVGLTSNGMIAVRNAKAVPLKHRQGINAMVSAENADRAKLYKEIAVANGHPEWENSIRGSFSRRWVDKAKAGWYYQTNSGWSKK